MFEEKQYKAHLESLTKEEIVEICLYWRRIDREWYDKVNKRNTENNLMTEL